MLFSGQFIRGNMSSICLITVDINHNQLVREVSARILHCKDTIFPFVIHKYLGGYLEVMYIFCFFLHFNQFYYSSCLQQLLLWFFNGNLLFPTSLLHLLFKFFRKENFFFHLFTYSAFIYISMEPYTYFLFGGLYYSYLLFKLFQLWPLGAGTI